MYIWFCPSWEVSISLILLLKTSIKIGQNTAIIWRLWKVMPEKWKHSKRTPHSCQHFPVGDLQPTRWIDWEQKAQVSLGWGHVLNFITVRAVRTWEKKNTTVCEVKNSLDGTKHKLDIRKKNFSELEDAALDTNQNKTQRLKKHWGKKRQNRPGVRPGTISRGLTHK